MKQSNLARHDFDRAAKTYTKHASLQNYVARQLLAILPPIEKEDAKVLDIGSGTGVLASLAGNVNIVQMDSSYPMVQLSSDEGVAFCGDMNQLPIKHESQDVILSSMALHWSENLAETLQSMYDALKPGGKCAFAIPVQGTLTELSQIMHEVNQKNRILAFPDAAELKDVVEKIGFSLEAWLQDPVTWNYDGVIHILQSIRGVGGSNKAESRNIPLTKKELEVLVDLYHVKYGSAAGVTASWRILYAVLGK